MPSTKDIVIDYVKSLPEDLTIEEIAYKIYFNEKITKGRQQMKEGKYLTHDDAKKRLSKWLK